MIQSIPNLIREYNTLSGCWTKYMIKLENSLAIFLGFWVYNH